MKARCASYGAYVTDDTLTKLPCPCGKRLFIGLNQGVPHYDHADASGDKSDCETLNSFVITNDLILAERGIRAGIGNMRANESPEMRTCYLASLSLRLAYYRKLETLSNDRNDLFVSQYIQRIGRMIFDAYNCDVLVWEMRQVFGDVMGINMQHLHIDALIEEAPEEYYDLPTLALLNLQDARVDAGVLDIINEVKTKTNGMMRRHNT